VSETKSIFNDTSSAVELTIYVAGRQGGQVQEFGTRQFSLASGKTIDVEYGDLHHPFLEGVMIKSEISGVEISQKLMVKKQDSDFDQALNVPNVIALSDLQVKWFTELDPATGSGRLEKIAQEV